MLDQLSVLKLVTSRLDRAGMAYMVTGSIAAGHYAQPRMTRDIDLVVELRPEDAGHVVELFRDQFECDSDAIRSAIERQSLFNLIHTEAIVKVDFIVLKNTPYRRQEFVRRRQAVIDSQQVWIVSPEDLILSKLAWARDSRSEIQMKDVRNVLSSTTTLDWSYLQRWATELGVEELLRELHHE